MQKESRFSPTRQVIFLAAEEKIEGYITANTVTDIYYIAVKHYMNKSEAREMIQKLLKLVGVIDVGHRDCIKAFELPLEDYEEALLVVCAKRIRADYIVTRDINHFRESPVPPILPEGFLKNFKG